MKINRAYSVLEWKSVDEDKRIIEGIATTPSPDRMNDVVELDGIEFKLPLPLLYQHNSRQPIGNVISAKKTKDGMLIKAQVAGSGVADFIDEAWGLVKAGLIRGLSIGFRSIEEAWNKDTGGYRFLRTEWLELSVVTVPANSEATILSIKSADSLIRAASGKASPVGSPHRPGVSGISQGKPHMKSIADRIKEFEARQKEILARMSEIEESTDDAEVEEYKGLTGELENGTERLKGLRAQEAAIGTAKAVKGTTPEQGSTSRAPREIVEVKSNLPKGHALARAVISLVNAKGNHYSAAEMAGHYYKDTPEVAQFLKSVVAAGDTTTSGFASQLVPAAQQMQNEFLELLRPATLIGRIPGLRRVPFNVSVPLQSGGGTYSWVGESKAKPVTKPTFGNATIRWAKAAGIVVITKELAKFSSPSAEAIIKDEMIKGCVQFLDGQFLDSTLTETNDHPAGITQSISPESPSGTTAEAFLYDLSVLLASFTAANQDPSKAVLLISATTALNLSLMKNALGQREFPDITLNGGTVAGIPCIVSETVSDRVVLVNASDILFADDGGVSIDVSEQASVEMDTAPISGESSPIDGAVLQSLWQRNLVGIRVERFISWKRARVSAVAWLDNVAYAPTAPASPE